jgi:hypothetical protein
MVTPPSWYPEEWGGHFPIVWSLGIICGVIGAAMVLSLVFPKRHATVEAADQATGTGDAGT